VGFLTQQAVGRNFLAAPQERSDLCSPLGRLLEGRPVPGECISSGPNSPPAMTVE
jgi:hypothetical protein